MKEILLFVLFSFSVYWVEGKIGAYVCEDKNIIPDAEMEHSLGVACPLEIDNELMDKIDAEPTPEGKINLISPPLGSHYKCLFGLIKAIDSKGKIIPKAADAFHASFKPENPFHKNMKKVQDTCIQQYNPEIKKETGKNGKSWGKFAICMMGSMPQACSQ